MPGIMGLLELKRVISMQRERKRRRQIQSRYGSITSVLQRKDSPCPEDDHAQGGIGSTYSGSNLPEDIWCHIHSLVPLQDAARSACVSRTLLRSWRCHPKLILSKRTLGLNRKACVKGGIARCFISRVDHILKNHSGIGVKLLRLEIPDYCNVNNCHLNNWLRVAITPGIEEVSIFLPSNDTDYNFPCPLLFDDRGNSIRYLYLNGCAFRPPLGFDCLKSLTKLHLYEVRITGDELGCLISKSFALEQLQLTSCCELNCLKIPFWLERLSCLSVFDCDTLQVIESKAPNLSTFMFCGDPVDLALRESSRVKIMKIGFSVKPNSVSYAITKLPSTVPNLETLTITSVSEIVNSPMVADKFLSLKYLKICLAGNFKAFSPAYDYLSLVSFLDASPVLETFILSVRQDDMKHDSIFGDASHMRQISGHKHDRLKKVQINGFCSAKSMVELTCHILENAIALESLTVDTVFDVVANGNISRCVRKTGECGPIDKDMILEAHKALRVVKRYIMGKVPSTVKLNVGEPCNRCHAIDVKLP